MPVAPPTTLREKDAPVRTSANAHTRQVLPPFVKMAQVSAAVCAVPIALFLMGGRVWPALGILGGWLLGLAMGGLLYGFINYGVGLFVPSSPSAMGQGQSAGQVGGFAALMVGKFVIIGALLFGLIAVMKLSIVWIVAGFFVTQITMIGMTVSRLAKTKATD